MTIEIYLIYLGLILLSLTLDKHYKEVVNKPINIYIQRTFAGFGSLILFISLMITLSSLGLSIGLTYWIGVLVPSIVFIALVFAYKPKIVLTLSVLLLLITIFL